MSQRIDLGPQGFLYPMPMTVVGADLSAGVDFMPIAWINRVQFQPPRLACGLGKRHATNAGIREHGEFGVSIPSVDMIAAVDWCGLNSASSGTDKTVVFGIVRGTLAHAPMVAECPLAMECRVVQVVDLGSHELFIADIVKLRPFTLTMPDNRYWSVGEQIGQAWSAGRSFDPNAPG
jgi:flavin reductase (DIM6/NTAB) family NADH-FMN oxidoreductase RutF